MKAIHTTHAGTRPALLVLALVLACACGPDAATPVPQPPAALEPDAVRLPEVVPLSNGLPLFGEPGAAQPGSVLRATNLDDTSPTVATTVRDDGSFSIDVSASEGDEIRFQVVSNHGRSQPTDLLFDAAELVPVERLSCLRVEPGLALTTDTTGVALRVTNACAETVTLDNLRFRLALPDFGFDFTPAPLDPGADALIGVSFEPAAAGPREDILFFDASAAGTTFRYAVTIFGE